MNLSTTKFYEQILLFYSTEDCVCLSKNQYQTENTSDLIFLKWIMTCFWVIEVDFSSHWRSSDCKICHFWPKNIH